MSYADYAAYLADEYDRRACAEDLEDEAEEPEATEGEDASPAPTALAPDPRPNTVSLEWYRTVFGGDPSADHLAAWAQAGIACV